RNREPALRRRAGGDDEADRTLLPAEGGAESHAALPQCKVQRGALERPAAVTLFQLLQVAEAGRESLAAPPPGEHEPVRHPAVRPGLVGDVLADAFVTRSLQDDRRRHPRPA